MTDHSCHQIYELRFTRSSIFRYTGEPEVPSQQAVELRLKPYLPAAYGQHQGSPNLSDDIIHWILKDKYRFSGL